MSLAKLAQTLCLPIVTLAVSVAAVPPLCAEEPVPASVVQVVLPVRDAQAVRVVIRSAAGGAEPCLDELEVYGPRGSDNLALASRGAQPSASSCLPGYTAHAIAHLNDGRYGNAYSWISAEEGTGWAQVTFPEVCEVNRVVLSRDRLGQYTDRGVVDFDVLFMNPDGEWEKVQQYDLVVVNPDAIPDPPPPPLEAPTRQNVSLDLSAAKGNAELVAAFLHEEYAWLQVFGRADLHPGLSQPRYGMERPGPRHVGDDQLPLSPLRTVPRLDGRLDDLTWEEASRGAVRVVSLDGFESSPLVEHLVWAGLHGDDLYLAIDTGRVLSQHIAIVSGGDWLGSGAVVFDGKALNFQSYAGQGRPETRPIDGAFNPECTTFEMRLPLVWFPTYGRAGLRVGLGMGGKYTSKHGRPVHFSPAPIAIAQDGPCQNGKFRVRVRLDDGASETRLTGNLPKLEPGISLKPGETVTLVVPAEKNAIGPEATVQLQDGAGAVYRMHLMRYVPATRVIDLASSLADRLEAKGVKVGDVLRAELNSLRESNNQWTEDTDASDSVQRQILFDVRMCKRKLLLSDPDLIPAQRLLFVKRHPFRPSHNYSVILDAPWNPGGGVCLLEMPWQDGGLQPDRSRVITLFDSAGGVARTPMADFECNTIYFAHKPSPEGFFHIYRMCPDGSELEKITDGPFHDYWPCPLPDGGVAFISTRCKRRFLCWRPQAATLHRMDADGGNMRALSYANLTEWAPSVMDDGRIIWTRSEYQDKAADFGHTLWAIRPDGTHPELIFGNTITKTNGYANGRYMPGTNEVACTLISHFGDLNGPIALLDLNDGRFNPDAIRSVTPEVFWPGSPPSAECFRDPVPLAKDYILCSHAPGDRFDLYIIDRFGNRELLYADSTISSMCPTPFLPRMRPPVLPSVASPVDEDWGEFLVSDVYRGLEPEVKAGEVAYLAVSVEVTHDLDQNRDGTFRADHEPFQQFYASPSDVLTGPYGWPTYVVKQRLGVVPVEADGSAYFRAPSGKVLYFHVLDAQFNELQRMRSVVQLQPGEQRSCIGCHEDRSSASSRGVMPAALRSRPRAIEPPPWGTEPFSFERVVQPVLDAHCVECHDEKDSRGLNFSGRPDENKIPASYRTLISSGLVHYADWTWSNPDVCGKAAPGSLGTLKSRLFEVIEGGHEGVALTTPELRALKTWVDLNCPLWPDYVERSKREPAPPLYAWLQSLQAGQITPTN